MDKPNQSKEVRQFGEAKRIARRRIPSSSIVFVLAALVTIASFAPALSIPAPPGPASPWDQVDRIVPEDADEEGRMGGPSHAWVDFGSTLAASGDLLAVSTAADRAADAAWVYLFQKTSSTEWNQLAKLEPPEGATGEGFGYAIALDHEAGVLVVGQPGYDRPDQEDAGAAYIYQRNPDGEWELAAELFGPAHDLDRFGPRFGYGVAVEGGTVVVGAPTQNTLGYIQGERQPGGALHVYELGADGWVSTQWIPAWGSEMGGLGNRLILDEGRLFVAVLADGELDQGAVYLLEEVGARWVQTHAFWAPDPGGWESPGGDCFGFSIDVAGAVVAIADPCWDSTAGFHTGSGDQGKVYVYRGYAGGWILDAQLHASDSDIGVSFGDSIAIDGETIVVGAGFGPPQRAGTAYVFTRDDGAWMQEARLTGDDTSSDDMFGWSSEILGSSILVGAPFDDNRRDGTPPPLDDDGSPPGCIVIDDVPCNAGQNAGTVYVFEQSGGEAIPLDVAATP